MRLQQADTTKERLDDEPDTGDLYLVVIGDSYATFPLPRAGSVSIGRSQAVDIQIDDPLASRQHVRLQVSSGSVTIEDLGSINGTMLRNSPLTARRPAGLMFGDTVTIGTTVLMLQASAWSRRFGRIWSRDYFESRLEDECRQAAITNTQAFAVAKLSLSYSPRRSEIVTALSATLRECRLSGRYSPTDYAFLFAGRSQDEVDDTIKALLAEVQRIDPQARVGVSWHPHDGKKGDLLLAEASRRLITVEQGVRNDTSPTAGSQSSTITRVYDLAERAARGDIPVLISGETGVGKEVLAEWLHRRSPRSGSVFVALNCAALSETLIESELFGHERGAFTGAIQSKAGLLEAAAGGTMFLDEISEMPMALQAKLLRVIESREATRIGSTKPHRIDVRFLSATNRDLKSEVEAGRFRLDLYFRLNGITITVPPLRERRRDILPLARQFLNEIVEALGRRPLSIPANIEAILENHAWPGNIRELKNVIERAALLCDGDAIAPEHLPDAWLSLSTSTNWSLANPAADVAALSDRQKDERQRMLDALNACAGNQRRAAALLKMPRSSFVLKLNRYRIKRPRKDD